MPWCKITDFCKWKCCGKLSGVIDQAPNNVLMSNWLCTELCRFCIISQLRCILILKREMFIIDYVHDSLPRGKSKTSLTERLVTSKVRLWLFVIVANDKNQSFLNYRLTKTINIWILVSSKFSTGFQLKELRIARAQLTYTLLKYISLVILNAHASFKYLR